MKKLALLIIGLLTLTSCQFLLPDETIQPFESDYTSSEFYISADKIPGKNANQVYFLRSDSIFQVILGLTLRDILGEGVIKFANLASIEEFYLIENNQGNSASPNYETFLILKYVDAAIAEKAANSLKTVLKNIELQDNKVYLRISKNKSGEQQAKLEGEFVNSSLYGPDNFHYGEQILYSAAFTKPQKDLAMSFFDILISSQEELKNPQYDENLSYIENLRESAQYSNFEKLTFGRIGQDQIKIVYETELTVEENLTAIKEHFNSTEYQQMLDAAPADRKELLQTDKSASIKKAVEDALRPEQAESAIIILHEQGKMKDVKVDFNNPLLRIEFIMPEQNLIGT